MLFFIFTFLVAALLYARSVPGGSHFGNIHGTKDLRDYASYTIHGLGIGGGTTLFRFWDAFGVACLGIAR